MKILCPDEGPYPQTRLLDNRTSTSVASNVTGKGQEWLELDGEGSVRHEPEKVPSSVHKGHLIQMVCLTTPVNFFLIN